MVDESTDKDDVMEVDDLKGLRGCWQTISKNGWVATARGELENEC